MLRIIRLARRLTRRVGSAEPGYEWALARARFGGPGGRELARAIRHVREPQNELPLALAEIETIRQSLLRRSDPLDPAGAPGAGITVAAACKASKPASQAILLYALVREFQPATIVELGTSLGISSAYMAVGLQGREARLVTLEFSPDRLRIAREVHSALGLTGIVYRQGLFADTLRPALKQLPAVDMAFIDGHHSYGPTLDYFETLLAHASPRCVFVFDDIRWSDEMGRAWAKLAAHGQIQIAADLDRLGVCIRGDGSDLGPLRIFLPLARWKRRRSLVTALVSWHADEAEPPLDWSRATSYPTLRRALKAIACGPRQSGRPWVRCGARIVSPREVKHLCEQLAH